MRKPRPREWRDHWSFYQPSDMTGQNRIISLKLRPSEGVALILFEPHSTKVLPHHTLLGTLRPYLSTQSRCRPFGLFKVTHKSQLPSQNPHVSTALQPPGAVAPVLGDPGAWRPSPSPAPSPVTGSTGCSPDTALPRAEEALRPRKPHPLKMGQLAATTYLYLPACFTSS